MNKIETSIEEPSYGFQCLTCDNVQTVYGRYYVERQTTFCDECLKDLKEIIKTKRNEKN